jgi:hypothetical protein
MIWALILILSGERWTLRLSAISRHRTIDR